MNLFVRQPKILKLNSSIPGKLRVQRQADLSSDDADACAGGEFQSVHRAPTRPEAWIAKFRQAEGLATSPTFILELGGDRLQLPCNVGERVHLHSHVVEILAGDKATSTLDSTQRVAHLVWLGFYNATPEFHASHDSAQND